MSSTTSWVSISHRNKEMSRKNHLLTCANQCSPLKWGKTSTDEFKKQFCEASIARIASTPVSSRKRCFSTRCHNKHHQATAANRGDSNDWTCFFFSRSLFFSVLVYFWEIWLQHSFYTLYIIHIQKMSSKVQKIMVQPIVSRASWEI